MSTDAKARSNIRTLAIAAGVCLAGILPFLTGTSVDGSYWAIRYAFAKGQASALERHITNKDVETACDILRPNNLATKECEQRDSAVSLPPSETRVLLTGLKSAALSLASIGRDMVLGFLLGGASILVGAQCGRWYYRRRAK